MDMDEMFDCRDCLLFGQCGDKCECDCIESNSADEILENIRDNIEPSQYRWMKINKFTDDCYIDFINSSLLSIRDGLVAEIYSIGQLCDIYKCEPRIKVYDGSSSYYVRL